MTHGRGSQPHTPEPWRRRCRRRHVQIHQADSYCRPSCRALALERRRQQTADLFTGCADAIEPEVACG